MILHKCGYLKVCQIFFSMLSDTGRKDVKAKSLTPQLLDNPELQVTKLQISIHELLSNTHVELLRPVRASEMTTCINELYSLCCKDGVDYFPIFLAEKLSVLLNFLPKGIIFAGTDANYATITWALALVLKHKEVLQRAQQELDLHIGQEQYHWSSCPKGTQLLVNISGKRTKTLEHGPTRMNFNQRDF
ncbi:hypothetical protein POM88_047790 [Heracleum sosnowskyi]|uniref:Uncharacterized protein n=1 Tax=Heracleum sosnowskyi TaxID=360622 RepID=A0AAD8GU56_9APIA|nr:hypothetical protein POM88_047790 [Heracleum sosnowskyi]